MNFFNTQQKQDDIYSPGNQNTALYWEYDTRLGRRWNIEPLIFKYPSNSSYLVLGNNPIIHFDRNGEDLVYFNRDGTEAYRKKSNTVFKTFIKTPLPANATTVTKMMDAVGLINQWTEIPMPKIIKERVESHDKTIDIKYQVFDYQIAAVVGYINLDLSMGDLQVYTEGGKPIPKNVITSIPQLDPTVVKAMVMQESTVASDGQTDIIQVNVPGDYETQVKPKLGLIKGVEPTVNHSLNAGIRFLITKGFKGGINGNGSFVFKGWESAIFRYGPGTVKYKDNILEMIKNSETPTPKDYVKTE